MIRSKVIDKKNKEVNDAYKKSLTVLKISRRIEKADEQKQNAETLQ